jgi:uncharacterized protein (TIGR02266 family)
MTIVSLSVRYTSATVDDFIEHHALDVSARGIYIKTERDIPLGTLIEFDVRIAANQTVLAGAGRVMWIRDARAATPERPPGIGVRFIELDEASKAVLDQLLEQRKDAGQRYMEEAEVAMSRVPTPPPSGTVVERSAPSLPPPAPQPGRRSSRPKAPTKGPRRSLPPMAPPPRRSTVPPRPSMPPETGDEDGSDSDNTQLGPLPPMPKGRKSTLVGLGAPVLPRVVAPPRRRTSRPPPAPHPISPPPPPPPRPRTSTPPLPPIAPPPRPPESRPAPLPANVPMAAEDDPEEATLIAAMPPLQTEAEQAPEALALPIDVEIPDAEPTVIVPRESPIPPPPVEMPPTEITAPQSMQDVHGLPPDVPRDLGDTQRIRRRGRRKRLALVGALIAVAAGAALFALSRQRPAPELPQATTASSAAAAPEIPVATATAPVVAAAAVEASIEPTADEAGGVAASASTVPSSSAAPPEPPPPVAATTAISSTAKALPPPVPIEFSAMPIERVSHPSGPKRPQPTESSESSTSTPTPTTPVAKPPSTPTTTSPAPAAASPNCNPTYTLDPEGNKHFKPECFTH